MTTDEMADALYDAELNFSITCFWDAGYEGKLGDHMNGFGETHHTDTFHEAIKAVYEDALRGNPGLRISEGTIPKSIESR